MTSPNAAAVEGVERPISLVVVEMSVRDAIQHPNFSHSRAGSGCWRDVRWIYHRNPASPSGVTLVAGGDAAEVEPLLRELLNTSPLSPEEPR